MIIRNDNIQEANLLNLVGGSGIDANASAYLSAVISAGGMVDSTSIQAVDTLFKSLKSESLYNKLIIMYPFVGGVGAAHSINALSPGTNDMFFRNRALDTWVHTQNGSYSSDTTCGSRTDGNYATVGSQYNATMASVGVPNPTGKSTASIFPSAADMSASVYTRGKLGRGTGSYPAGVFGPAEGGNNRFQFNIRYQGGDESGILFPSTTGDFLYYTTDYIGYYVMSRTSTSYQFLLKNGTIVQENTETVTCELDGDSPLFINSSGSSCDTLEYAFMHFGEGLNGTQSTTLTNIVQTFQTSLGRAV